MEFQVSARRVDAHDRLIALLHDNVRKHGTVFNAVAPGTALSGTARRSI